MMTMLFQTLSKCYVTLKKLSLIGNIEYLLLNISILLKVIVKYFESFIKDKNYNDFYSFINDLLYILYQI